MCDYLKLKDELNVPLNYSKDLRQDFINTEITEVDLLESKKDYESSFVVKPYFVHKDNIYIYNCDILKFNSIPDNSIDLIVTSPPYNTDVHYNCHKDDIPYSEYL